MSEFLPLDTRTGKVRNTSSNTGTEAKPFDFTDVFVIGIGDAAGITNAALTQLVNGQSYIDVVFDSEQTDNTWIFVECSVVNTADANPLNIWPGIITGKTSTGFRLQLNGLPDSNNYFLSWAISGVNIAPTPATTFVLAGPASGGIGVASVFTVHLPASSTVPAPVTVTPSDSGGGGTFSPTSVTLTTGTPSTTFTYTPASAGTKTISVTNTGGLLNPVSISFLAFVFATGYSLSGPASGTVGVVSTPFTVTLTPAGGAVSTPVTVTPSSGGGGGTFTPTTVALTTAAPSATFTYTPASTGTKTISTTNNGGLTNPGGVTYTVSVAQHLLDTLIGYWTLDEGSGTRVDSTANALNLTPANNPLGVAGKINNGCNFVAASVQRISRSSATFQVTSSFTFSLWVKLTSQIEGVALSKWDVSGSDYGLVYRLATGYEFMIFNPSGAASSMARVGSTTSNGVWMHLVAWHNAATGQVYLRVNDTTTYQSTTAPVLAQSASVFAIGDLASAGAPIDAIVDEVGFWKRVLTSDEITALYNGGAGFPYSSFTA